MLILPIAAVSMPSDLVGITNGNIPDALLAPCGVGSFRMHHFAARAMRALVDAAMRAGHIVRSTGTTRTYPQQVDLFRERYAIGATGGGCKAWDSDGNGKAETWCKKSATLATAAVPGTSNHGWALAIDFAEELDGDPQVESVSPEFVEWLIEHAHEFGYSAELQSELWHWRYVAGDEIPAAVLAFEQPAQSLPASHPVDPEEDDMAGPAIAAIYKPSADVFRAKPVNRHFALLPDGSVRSASGPDVEYAADAGAPVKEIKGTDHYEQLCKLADAWRAA